MYLFFNILKYITNQHSCLAIKEYVMFLLYLFTYSHTFYILSPLISHVMHFRMHGQTNVLSDTNCVGKDIYFDNQLLKYY